MCTYFNLSLSSCWKCWHQLTNQLGRLRARQHFSPRGKVCHWAVQKAANAKSTSALQQLSLLTRLIRANKSIINEKNRRIIWAANTRGSLHIPPRPCFIQQASFPITAHWSPPSSHLHFRPTFIRRASPIVYELYVWKVYFLTQFAFLYYSLNKFITSLGYFFI